jgi:predicted nucleotide-binding protein
LLESDASVWNLVRSATRDLKMKPTIFVGSSVEGLAVAYAVQQNLEFAADVTVWPQGIFELSNTTLGSLLGTLDRADFGIFVFSPDDIGTIRNAISPIVRDNVLFELGLFVGRLGPHRSFILMPRDESMHMPSDLIGIIPAQYNARRPDGNLRAALGPACAEISNLLRITPIRSPLTTKEAINSSWRNLIGAASRSIKILAGDASWAPRDTELFQSRALEGIEIAVLCENPGEHIRVRQNLALLLRAGIDVRMYSTTTKTRGLVVDWGTDCPGAALRVSKKPRNVRQVPEGQPGTTGLYEYRASQYLADENSLDIQVMAELFDALFASSPPAILLQAANASISEIAGILSAAGIEQYASLQPESIRLVAVTADEIWSCCRFVKRERLLRVRDLTAAYESHGLRAFETAIALSRGRETLVLPPILERHDDRYVLIDGTHRLFTRLMLEKEPHALCLAVNCTRPLPSHPLPFKDVVIAAEKRSKSENFPKFDEGNYRRMKLLQSPLEAWAKGRGK